jgi:hypothetical protein
MRVIQLSLTTWLSRDPRVTHEQSITLNVYAVHFQAFSFETFGPRASLQLTAEFAEPQGEMHP